MSIFVYLSALLAMANCAGMLYAGFGIWHAILFFLSLALGIAGIFVPGPDKADGRVISVLAIIMASLPILKEPIIRLRYTIKERSYAKKIVPLAAEWKSAREKFSEEAALWEKNYGSPPVFDGLNPIVPGAADATSAGGAAGTSNAPGDPGATGATGTTNATAIPGSGLRVAIAIPNDPFEDLSGVCRYWSNTRDQWVLLSKGPDKTIDIKLPPAFRSMDRADSRGRWLAVNEENFANLLYDPTNGSLGKGDLLWVDGSADATVAFQNSMTGAWSRAMSTIGSTRPGANDAQTAGAAARSLYDQGDTLAALAAGTYSGTKIPRYRAQQTAPDFEGRLAQGQALYDLGDPRMAANALAAYIELNPNDPRGHYHLGAALYYSGDTEEARGQFAAASQIDEAHPLARPAYDALLAISQGTAPPGIPPPGKAVVNKPAGDSTAGQATAGQPRLGATVQPQNTAPRK